MHRMIWAYTVHISHNDLYSLLRYFYYIKKLQLQMSHNTFLGQLFTIIT